MQIFLQTQKPYTFDYSNPTFKKRTLLKNSEKDIVAITKKLTEFQQKKIARDKQILDMLLGGFSRKQVVETLGVSMSKVVRIAEENNVFRRVTDERNKRIVDKLKQGLTVTEVAKSENIDNTTVIRSARKSNFQIKFNKNEVRNEEIKKDLLAGIKDSIIAAKYKLSEGSIKRLKRGFGLTKEYHFLPVTNGFRFDEIKEQSQNITKLRETYRRFKLGERTPEILEEMEKTLDILKAKIQEFKSRFE